MNRVKWGKGMTYRVNNKMVITGYMYGAGINTLKRVTGRSTRLIKSQIRKIEKSVKGDSYA